MIEKKYYIYLIFLAILSYGIFLRVYKLDSVPPGLWYDEAINGLDAVSTITSFPHIPLVYTTEGHPREPIFLWLLALSLKTFGVSTLIMRYTTIFIGILTIIAFYFLAKEYFNIQWALVALFIFAAMRWNFHINRLIFRANLINLVGILFLIFFIKFLDSNKRKYAIISGIILGMGFYTYLSIYAFAGCVITFLLVNYWRDLKEKIKFRTNVILLFSITGVIFLPLFLDYIINTNHFFGRVGEVSLFESGFLSGLKLIVINIFKILLMFIYKGDLNQKFNISGMPNFDYLTGVIFIIGLIFSIATLKAVNKKNGLLLFYFVFMLLPSVFSVDAPHLLRAFGAVPSVAIILTLGYIKVFEIFKKRISKNLTIILIGVLILFYCSNEYRRYFILWADDTRTWYNFNTDWYQLGQDLKSLEGENKQSIVFLNDDIFNHPTFKFETLNLKSLNVHPFSKLNTNGNINIDLLKFENNKNKYIFIYFRDINLEIIKILNEKIKELDIRLTRVKIYKTPDNFTVGILYKINKIF